VECNENILASSLIPFSPLIYNKLDYFSSCEYFQESFPVFSLTEATLCKLLQRIVDDR